MPTATSDLTKGKQRAPSPPTEQTPLLPSSSTAAEQAPPAIPTCWRRHRLRSILILVFVISLFICIATLILLGLIAYSYASRASHVSPTDLLDRALVFKGPDRMDVLNTTSEGFWLQVEGRVGVDAGSVIGATSDPGEDGVWQDIMKAMGRWGIKQLERVSVELSTINVSAAHDPSIVLAFIDVSPLELPLTAAPPPGDLSWLTKVSTPLLIRSTRDTGAIIRFVRQAWRDGTVAVQAEMERAIVTGGGLTGTSWRQRLSIEREDIQLNIQMKMPPLPGLPIPGRNSPFPPMSQLVTLQSFNASSSDDKLSLYARATVVNPLPQTFSVTSPPLLFTISLPALNDPFSPPIHIASVLTTPFSLTHPNITLVMSGTVLPLPAYAVPTLSHFLSRYLSAQANHILISTPLVPGLSVDTLFPAPNPKPELLRNVTIRDMKVRATPSGTFLASGTVFGRVVLPTGLNVGLDVTRVFPDVLVFDGKIPDMIGVPRRSTPIPSANEGPPASPLPDPLPERAFGRIRPDGWLDSVCVLDESGGTEGAAYSISAKIVDAVVQVLPGRQKEFSAFMGKVIFDVNGALAGILGSASVAVDVKGLPFHSDGRREMELSDLPFRGSIRVGKKNMPG